MQAAARAAAAATQVSAAIPNGLGAGGLQPNIPVDWTGANAPTQSVDGAGQTQVNIRQTTQQAILDWQSFNVGARTTLTFDQQNNRNWVALNRVDRNSGPSQILGNIKADGQVYVINQSGIIFGGAAQVNVGSLIASTAQISNDQFLKGIYSTRTGSNWTPSFTDATALLGNGRGGGVVKIEAGAQIATHAPAAATSGGGFVLLMGGEVVNAGAITTPMGQTQLAAGDAFVLRAGYGTETNQFSTTRGNEIAVGTWNGTTFTSGGTGRVRNEGLIVSPRGDVTLVGHAITQDGVLLASTSVNSRGTVHLLNSATDIQGIVTLGANSLTTVVPELESTETALDSQRDGLIAASADANLLRSQAVLGAFDNLSKLADRLDLSRIEIVTGGHAVFEGGSLTIAQGGQILVSAGNRLFAETGATINASGVRDVALAMSANNVMVNIQGNELRDSPQNRESSVLKNNDVWVDLRGLTLVPDGTGGYVGDRYYTKGGLLEVGGYVANTTHKIGEWSAVGGSITLSAPEVVAQKGSVFDISGGSLTYAAGWIRSTNLIGSDGRRYSVDNAPGNMSFVGFAGGFRRTHNIQGQEDKRLTEVWTTVFDRGRTSLRWEEGYTVGRDAGRVILSAPTAIFEADILADIVSGKGQTSRRAVGVSDGYKVTQTTVAQAGTLALGGYAALGRVDAYVSNVRIDDIASITAGLTAMGMLPAERLDTLWLDAGHLNTQRLGGIDLATRGSIAVDSDLILADGGALKLIAPSVDIRANVTARSGIVAASNIFTSERAGSVPIMLLSDGGAHVTLHAGATLSVAGRWVNELLDPDERFGLGYLDGGRVNLTSTHDVTLADNSLVDVSSGAAILANGKTRGAKGGDVTLEARSYIGSSSVLSGKLVLDGALRSYGVAGGGTLVLGGSPVLISDDDVAVAEQVLLRSDFFRRGFSQYTIKGNQLSFGSVAVADGTVLSVEMPVYRLAAKAYAAPTGDDSATALEVWTPPRYLENAATRTITQRKGAGLAFADVGSVSIGVGSRIEVDPGQSIAISSVGQVTIDGRLNAWGGTIAVNSRGTILNQDSTVMPGRSIWIGDDAVLDAAARAVTGLDLRGRQFALVPNGGTIRIGTDGITPAGLADKISTSFVIVRPGAVLDASGAGAKIDLAAGALSTVSDVRTLASQGGSIVLASSTGIALEGKVRAASGGEGAAGGNLSLILESAVYTPADIAALKQPRILTITQARQPPSLPVDLAPGEHRDGLSYTKAWLSAEQVQAGGFDNLLLSSSDIIRFEGDVVLGLGQSLRFQSGVISVADTTPQALVSLAAPVIRFEGGGSRVVGARGEIVPVLQRATTGSWRPAAMNVGRLTLEADVIDIAGGVRFGASDQYAIGFVPGSDINTINVPIEVPGFSDIRFFSRGDIRLSGSLASAGDVTFTATQLYPVTGASATILAGAAWDGAALRLRPDSVLAIRSNGQPAQTPSSVFGSLGLSAGLVKQDGVLRAPLGFIRLGGVIDAPGFSSQDGGRVVLGEHSITSVSAAGLVIPYGGTVDGLTYNYNGQELTLPNLMKLDAMGKIEVAATRFEARPGALLDLSGGGELAGAGFIVGRGGSVDILRTPLVNASPAFGFSAASNKVYAILPGFASDYAPIMQEKGAGDPALGQQVTIPSGVAGLLAGTYTLLPSTYALLPGAYRVEIGGGLSRDTAAVALGNNSYAIGAYLGVANTTIHASMPNQIVLTPGTAVRTHSQYNDTSYSKFALEQASRLGTARARLPIDGKQFVLTFAEAGDVLDFKGTALFAPGDGGFAGTLLLQGYKSIEIKAAAAQATAGMISFNAEDLSRFNTGTLFVNGSYSYIGAGTVVLRSNMQAGSVAVRRGAVLEAGQILLAGVDVSVEDGAVLDTTRSTVALPDSTLGYVFANGIAANDVTFSSVLVVANGWFDLLPALLPQVPRPSALTVADGAILRTSGTVGFVAADKLSLGQTQLNARYLALSLPAVNVGTETSLAAAAAAGVLGTGWNLTQTTLDRLLNPATTNLAALERLSFSARDGINFYGNVTLDARNHGAGSAETMVILNTPSIYGWGDERTSAILSADTLIWNGIAMGTGTVEDPYTSLRPPTVRPGGAGTGSGHLTLDAREILFGYDPLARRQTSAELERLALGFSGVNIVASEKVTANSRGIASFYRSGTDPASYAGGNLVITTPLLTTDSGAMIDIRAGGAIAVNAAGGTANPSALSDLGGEIRLSGRTIALDTTVALPTGRLRMMAQGDIVLGDRALVDLSGRAISFYEVTKYSWGGSLKMESRAGRVLQAAGSVIDVSARNNDAGSIEVSTVGGTATFSGTLRGDTSGGGNGGHFSLSATIIADFAGLNARLNASGFFGERSFAISSGNIVIGDEVRAHTVNIAANGGSLIVNGKIDASGEKVGNIRLSARDGLTLTSSAVLDIHGSVLQTDSHGAPIEASNRGSIELTASNGTVTLADGVTIDMRSADSVARGKLEINAPRVGGDGIAIDAANRVNILGASSIAVNGFRNYAPLDGIVDQAYLDGIHSDSTDFVGAASLNGALQARLAGLKVYGSAFHLRPGVEITSAGDLTTRGDLDLAGYRYGSDVNPGIYGSGEPGVLVMRAGGSLKIHGSINDGFAPPPPTQDDYNWTDGRAGKMWIMSPMLTPGSLSWSMRLVSGADLAASDTRAVKRIHALGESGDLVLDDHHVGGGYLMEAASVVRTGTGYLDLIAGRNYRHASLFGVYTAGTALTETQNYTGIWLTDGGGDVRIEAGGTLAGYSYMSGLDTNQRRINEWLRSENGAWGISFGAYVMDTWWTNALLSFAGIGALGGGNVHVIAGGDAGVMSPQIVELNPNTGFDETRASGLVVAIGGGGYVDAGGALRQTGGGDLTMKIGGRLNMAPLYQSNYPGGGMLVNVRGDISVTASAIGLVNELRYGTPVSYADPRPVDPNRPYDFAPDSGIMLALGDSRASIKTLGNLVILHASDPGASDPASYDGSSLPTINAPAFSLWTNRTSIDLFSAGGSVAPISTYDRRGSATNSYYSYGTDRPYPPSLGVVAAGGDVLVAGRAELAAFNNARLDLFARDSIRYAINDDQGGNYLTIRGDAPGAQPPAAPMRFYALNGDITNLRIGHILESPLAPRYVGSGPVWLRAGRDIIGAGGVDNPASDWADESEGGLIVHNRDTDVSIVEAGRDIIYANLKVVGPGTLALTAGRHIYQADKGTVLSLGAIVPGDKRPGASIMMQAGVGATGPNYGALMRYLDPVNLATAKTALADQPGKVARTYEKELTDWLKGRYGYEAAGDKDALAYFTSLPSEQRDIFLRTVYFAELRAGGREYNNPESPRFNSYLRGRQIISALFPDNDVNGNPIAYAGDITMFGGAAARTQDGGDIQMLAPGGQIIVGVEGKVPPALAGLIVQREGDIQMYSKGSILLGLSRIMTNIGGDIFAWSAEGDINAGRGSKTTIVYTPPRRVTDNYGTVTLSPNGANSGAGISARSAIPGVPSGDVDLIAPLGTIDVGEAGISGRNINLAALQIINAANITAQGNVTGVPTVQAPNIATALATSNATAATQQTTAPNQGNGNERPSVIIVEVLGYGGDGGGDNPGVDDEQRRRRGEGQDPRSRVQILDVGEITTTERRVLADERRPSGAAR